MAVRGKWFAAWDRVLAREYAETHGRSFWHVVDRWDDMRIVGFYVGVNPPKWIQTHPRYSLRRKAKGKNET